MLRRRHRNTVYQHIIILFTDGLNTGDRWYGDFSSQSAQVDTRMKTLCDSVKAAASRSIPCRSTPMAPDSRRCCPIAPADRAEFFMLTQPSQIARAFQQIGTQIAKLRVSK